GEAADRFTLGPPRRERDQDGLYGRGPDRHRLPIVDVRRDLRLAVHLEDAIVRDRDERQPVRRRQLVVQDPHRIAGDVDHRVDPAPLQLGQPLAEVDRQRLARYDAGQLEQQASGEVRAAALVADGDPLPGQLVEVPDVRATDHVDIFVEEREHHPEVARDARDRRIRGQGGDEVEDVRLHDPELDVAAFEDGANIVDRPARRIDPQLDAAAL